MEKNIQELLDSFWNYINGEGHVSVSCIAPMLEELLWGYYKSAFGEESVKGRSFWGNDKESQQKIAEQAEKQPFASDDEKLFVIFAQLWQILNMEKNRWLGSDFYDYNFTSNLDTLLTQMLEHRLGRKILWEELTGELLFSELEKIECDGIEFYSKNTRYLFFLDFFRKDTDRFFRNLNNLVFNKLYQKATYNFLYDQYLESGDKENKLEEIKKTLLDAELNEGDLLIIFKLFGHYNKKKDWSHYDGPSQFYIYKIEVIEWFFRDFCTELGEKGNSFENTGKQPPFSDALAAFKGKIETYPALAILLEKAASKLELEGLAKEFPCHQKSEMLNDFRMSIELMEPKLENRELPKIESMMYAAMACFSFDNDVNDKRPLSDEEMSLLQKLFSASLWRYIVDFNFAIRNGKSYFSDKSPEQYKQLVDFIFDSIKNSTCFSPAVFAQTSNMIFTLCFVNKKNPFTGIDFSVLNKSTYFKSNEALLHLYYTLSHFSDGNCTRIVMLEMLDFIREAQLRIIPIKEFLRCNGGWTTNSLQKNADKLKELDCGFTLPYLFHSAFMEINGEMEIKRPNFTFRLWGESMQKFDKYGKNKNWYRFNKLCLTNHFFHTADRNMETHFCAHHVLTKVLREPKSLLQILYDAGKYLDEIEAFQSEDSIGVRFLKEKYRYITSNILLVIGQQENMFESLFDKKGSLKFDFDLREDFGQEFYNTVSDFLSVMLTAQSDWFLSFRYELMAYLIYITISLVQEDAEHTKEDSFEFNISNEEKDRRNKTVSFQEAATKKRGIIYVGGYDVRSQYSPFLIFESQFRDGIESHFRNQFLKLPVSAKIHLHNGEFEKLPKYILQMDGVILDAKRLLAIREKSSEWEKYRESYKQIVLQRWQEYSNREDSNRLHKTWDDVGHLNINCRNSSSYGLWIGNIKFVEEQYNELSEVDTFPQKLFSLWVYHLKLQAAVAMSDDGERIELFLGAKTSRNNTPSCTISANCCDLNSKVNFLLSALSNLGETRENPYTSSSTENLELKELFENFTRDFAADFLKDKNMQTARYNTCTLEELLKAIQTQFNSIARKKRCSFYCQIQNALDKDQIIVFQSYGSMNHAANFGVILSDDCSLFEVFLECFKDGKRQLFSMPIENVPLFCDFVYEFSDYVDKKFILYDDLPQDLKSFFEERMQDAIDKLREEERRKIRDLPDTTQYPPIIRGNDKLDEKTALKRLCNNFDPNKEVKKVYIVWFGDESEFSGEIRCVSYTFLCFRKQFTLKVTLKNDDSSLLLELHDFRDKPIHEHTVQLAQYALLSEFVTKLCKKLLEHKKEEVFEDVKNEYPEGYPPIQTKCNMPLVRETFSELAKKIFDEQKSSNDLKLSPEKFNEKLRNFEYPDDSYKLATSYCELTEENGIPQIILSTGTEIAHIQLAIVLCQNLCELEVYLDKKASPDDKPLFCLPISDFRELEQFFAELKAHQVEDFESL